MSLSAAPPAPPASAGEALAMARAGLAWLACADAASIASMPAAELADYLRALGRVESAHTAAHAKILAAFTAQSGYEDDGHGGPRPWLIWQTRITRGAAGGALGWARRVAAHPAVFEALAAEAISASWARRICDWSDLLPAEHRATADQILLAAAAGGADLADLAGLAEEIYVRCAPPDRDGDDGFTRRSLRLDMHFRGAGKLDGNLTPGCAAGLRAVLDSLGKKAGPEDDRTKSQREHDALEEAMRRLLASRCLPEVAGQPVQAHLHITLDQLRRLPGASEAEQQWAAARRAWLAGRAAEDGRPGWVTDPVAAEAYACDAQIAPLVTGHVDPAAVDAMIRAWLATFADPANGGSSGPACPHPAATSADTAAPDPATGDSRGAAADTAGRDPLTPAVLAVATRELTTAMPVSGEPFALPRWARQRLADILLRYVADAVSGPGGLASFLRTGLLPGTLPEVRLPDPAASVSLPLDVGTATNTIPPWLRRAVIERDRHCAFPGCTQPPAACHVHHLIPRSDGGATALVNMVLLCAFHHLIAVHRWGWTLALNGDGTTTATSRDGKRVLHSHGPPAVPVV